MPLKEEDYKTRLVDLNEMYVKLDSDPVADGLSTISEKIAEIQSKKDTVSSYLVEAIANKSYYESVYDTEKLNIELEQDRLCATDADVKSQKSDTSRKSAANVKMSDKLLANHTNLLAFVTAESYLKSVYQVYNNLCSAQENLSRQISVVQMSMNIGEISRSELQKIMPRTIKLKDGGTNGNGS